MIVGFRHKGLKRLFEKDDAAGTRPDLVDKVRTILIQLDEATTMRANKSWSVALWSVTVRANWRIVFRFHDGDAADVELIDYD